MLRAALFVSPILSVAAAQQPQPPAAAAVEVVGPAAVPSFALLAQLKKGEDELVLFDVGYGVRKAVVQLHERWGHVEGERADGLRELLVAMRERWAGATDPDGQRAARVAAVAQGLLLGAAFRDPLPDPFGLELAEVEAGGAGTLRFLEVATPADWSDAVPRGGYAPRHEAAPSDLAGLFRATVYLQCYFAAWPCAATTAWREQAAACRRSGAAPELTFVEKVLPILFGVGSSDGMPQPGVAADLAWLRAQAQTGLAHDVLPQLFAAVPMPAPASIADGVLRLCHELAGARPDAALFTALAPEQWQAKWRDAAAFAYVGLREVDPLMRCVGRERLPSARVVIEPLPRVWEALRWLARRSRDYWAVRSPDHDWHEGATWVDSVLEVLARQQRGEQVPPELEASLLRMLLESFDEPDTLAGTISHVDGVRTPLRRADPHFVRVPIRWRGEVKQALALRLYVEQQDAAGRWHGPPWGLALQVPAATSAPAQR